MTNQEMLKSASSESKRVKMEVKSTNDYVGGRRFDLQFNQMYSARLNSIRPVLIENAKRNWIGIKFVDKVLDVELGEKCFIVGTVYVDCPLKPSILNELSQDQGVVPEPPKERYTSEKDGYLLEDDSGRIKLTGSIIASQVLVTGAIVAVLGTQINGGEIEVEEFGFPNFPPQKVRQAIGEDKYVALVCGLNVGSKTTNPLASQLMVDFVTGQLGSAEDQKEAAHVGHVIIAGNSLSDEIEVKDPQKNQKFRGKSNQYAAATEFLHQLDDTLFELSNHVTVDVMPGEKDPATFTLPQTAFFRGLLPRSATLGSFTTVSNPHHFVIDSASFLVTSGQTVNDIYRYSKEDDKLTLMEHTLKWRHIAPTAPDTLACAPVKDADPFVLRECPHVYVAANQSKFESRKVKGPEGQECTLILVPSFHETSTIVLVNLRTLEASPVSFKTWN